MDIKSKQIPRHLYDLSAGGLCGVFLPCSVMRKVAREMAEHAIRVKKILTEHSDELYTSHWTCANLMEPGGISIKKQEIVHFTIPDTTWDNVGRRIELFKPPQPEVLKAVYRVESYEEAGKIAEGVLADMLEASRQSALTADNPSEET